MGIRWESRQFIVRMTLGLVSLGAFVVWASRRGPGMWGDEAPGRAARTRIDCEGTWRNG